MARWEGCVLVTTSPDHLNSLLGLVSQGEDRFAGQGGRSQVGTRVFGGLVVAQALVAAGRTVGPDRQVNSLYAAVWLRCREPIGDDPLMHAAALTYASDLFLLSSALLPHGMALSGGSVTGTTLGHAVWFHEPFKADDWLLYEQTSPWTGSGRAMTQGQVFDRSGAGVATLAQEGLLRQRTPAQRCS